MTDLLRIAAERTREDLGPDTGARNYPDVRELLRFTEFCLEPHPVPLKPIPPEGREMAIRDTLAMACMLTTQLRRLGMHADAYSASQITARLRMVIP